MNWNEHIDIYCERVDASYWSEPVNALTNLAFILAAGVMLLRALRTPPMPGRPLALMLAAVLFAIGVGSYLFHTHANVWSSTADVVPIGLFILIYLYAVNRDFLGLPVWVSALAVVAFAPYAAAVVTIANQLPFFHISNFYWTVPILLVAYTPFVRRRNEASAQGMMVGAALLTGSITLRSLDMGLCDILPLGTHFLWHCLNAIMLGWMIEVYRRHMVAEAATAR